MARKDHSLDPVIIESARAEFLEHGYQKASLHTIAERAGITTGALYTRYKNKDELFCSLIQPALEEIETHIAPVEARYRQAHELRTSDALVDAIRAEEQIYLDLLFEHYDACVLLYCRSAGSSLELEMNRMMERKAAQTVEFFRTMARKKFDFSGIELIMSEQFAFYRQVLLRGYTKDQAVSCLKTVDLFLEAGWKALFDQFL